MITDRANPFVCCQGKVFCVGNTDSEKAGVSKTYVRYDKGCRKYRHPFSIVWGDTLKG